MFSLRVAFSARNKKKAGNPKPNMLRFLKSNLSKKRVNWKNAHFLLVKRTRTNFDTARKKRRWKLAK